MKLRSAFRTERKTYYEYGTSSSRSSSTESPEKMAPPRAQNVSADETKPETAGSSKNRHQSSTAASTNQNNNTQQQHQPPQASTSTGRSRRNIHGSAAGGGGAGKSAAATNAASTGTTGATATPGGNVGATGQSGQASGTTGIDWSAVDTPTLHAYRHLYRLETPSAFKSTFNQMVLSNPGIGRLSPTMIGRSREKRRVGKEQLALAVRKHFNDMPVVEMDVIPEFLNRAQNDQKEFRPRFGPRVTKRSGP
ncbi:MAG: hypothetical protein M1815_001534 [Lichina confinis]|nr:MAG: hypothetical protein M1815_001534 [Lichina confinis]